MYLWQFLFIFALILLNGVFAMSELAVVSSRRARLKRLGTHGALAALRLIDDPSRFLSTVQIGITLIGIGAGAYGGATIGKEFGAWLNHSLPFLAPYGEALGMGLVILLITYLSLIFGELVPKRVALHNPERIAVLLAPFMVWLSRVAAPLVWLLKMSTDAMLRLLKRDLPRENIVTEDEIKSLITEGTQSGIFVPQEREMIEGVLRLADRTVRRIMTPRSEVGWLDIGADTATIQQQIAAADYSHFPVCRDNLDELVGIVSSKDLLDAALRGEPLELGRYIREPLVVPEGTLAFRLLDQLKKSRAHIAVVVDEFGMIEGVATLTDMMQSIVGELAETPTQKAVRRDDGSWLVDGMLPIDEFEFHVGLHGLKSQGKFETVGGFVLHVLGHFPVTGEYFIHEGTRFEVVDMDGHRVDKLLVHPLVPEETMKHIDL